jgi:hypothetical protein
MGKKICCRKRKFVGNPLMDIGDSVSYIWVGNRGYRIAINSCKGKEIGREYRSWRKGMTINTRTDACRVWRLRLRM